MLPLHDNLPRRGSQPVTLALVGLNVAVFVLLFGLPADAMELAVYRFGLVPAPRHAQVGSELGLGRVLPYFTCQFLHAGLLHLLVNMWTLAIFGRGVEARLGSARFLVFYLLAGALAGVAHVVANPTSTVPVLGASGAIAGVMGAYLRLFPRAQLLMLVPIFFYPLFFPVPAVLYLLFWLWLQVYSGALSLLSEPLEGGVAWWAHVGGFVAGVILVGLFTPRRRRPVVYEAWDPVRRRWRRIDL